MSFDESGFDLRASTGAYRVDFLGALPAACDRVTACKAAIIDARVLALHGDALESAGLPTLRYVVDVSEAIKTPDTSLDVCRALVEGGFRRGDTLLAVGGGVIQDLATFAASVLYRGVDWHFLPTTLLAQADSCLGGKSSLNLGPHKNLIGNFYPPRWIGIHDGFLDTLEPVEIRSGIGEILKVQLLSGRSAAADLEAHASELESDRQTLRRFIHSALALKRGIVEEDEFDTGSRLRMNFGHSFGHAIEAATHFGITHGVAVTLGIGIAAEVALGVGAIDGEVCRRIRDIASTNLRAGDLCNVPHAPFFEALRKDKKNRDGIYRLVLPQSFGEVALQDVPMNESSDAIITRALDTVLTDAGAA